MSDLSTNARRQCGRADALPDARPILCIGAANLDRKLRPLAPLQLNTSNPARQDESFGGVARNIAENLARMGAPVALLTAVGGDASGRALLEHAQSLGIDTGATLRVDGACSGTYTAVLDQHGEMMLALADMALYDRLTPGFMEERRPQRAAAALTVADLNLPRATIERLIADAARDAIPLMLVAVSEPKMERLPAGLHGVRLLILNLGELETRVGRKLEGEAALLAACREVQVQGARDIIVTLGGAGVVHTTGAGIARLAAPHARIVDVTGAGDAFAAAVCWSLFHGSGDLALACRRGLELSAMTLACEQTVCPDLGPATFAHSDEESSHA